MSRPPYVARGPLSCHVARCDAPITVRAVWTPRGRDTYLDGEAGACGTHLHRLVTALLAAGVPAVSCRKPG